MMTKFNVGDRVSVNNHMFVLSDNQRRGTIVGISHTQYRVKLDNYGTYTSGILTFSAPQLSRTYGEFATDRRLTEAEAKIAALESKVAALETVLADKSKLSNNHAPSVDAMIAMGRFVQTDLRTPNQRRADVIKRAQAFVADLEKRASEEDAVNSDGNELFNVRITQLEFHVNAEKRVVTALAKYYNGEVAGKAFAKCAPGDVFNASIGKAVAAGRLYGLDVSEFENAVKPTVVAVGMVVEGGNGRGFYTSDKRFKLSEINGSISGSYNYEGSTDWIYRKDIGTIIDDTEAVYE